MPEALKEKKYRFITIRQAVVSVKEAVDGGLNREGGTFEGRPVYRIFNNKLGGQLGILSYYKPWKQYVFSSQPECVFNDACLRDVLDFLALTKGAKGK